MTRKAYRSDVSDEEWVLVVPYLVLLPETTGRRRHGWREVFNGLRYVVKTGAPWRWMPNDLPPWDIVYAQARRWLGSASEEVDNVTGRPERAPGGLGGSADTE